MQRLLQLSFILTYFLTSCGNSQSKENKTETKVQTDIQAPLSTITEKDLADFPNEWLALTKKDSSYIIFNPCDNKNGEYSIVKKDNKIYLREYYGQEDDTLEILNFIHNPDNTYDLTVFNRFYEDGLNIKYHITYIDSLKTIAKWAAYFPPIKDSIRITFINKRFAKNFNIVNQPCIECWEEDMCDEFEKKK